MIKDLKELNSLLLLCRKQGVTEIILGDCHIKLGEMPRKLTKAQREAEETELMSDELTEEQLMFYSVGEPSQ